MPQARPYLLPLCQTISVSSSLHLSFSLLIPSLFSSPLRLFNIPCLLPYIPPPSPSPPLSSSPSPLSFSLSLPLHPTLIIPVFIVHNTRVYPSQQWKSTCLVSLHKHLFFALFFALFTPPKGQLSKYCENEGVQ